MKLTQKQKNELLNAYFKAKDANTLLEIDMKTVRERSNAKRATYLHNKKLIDEVFYNEVGGA